MDARRPVMPCAFFYFWVLVCCALVCPVSGWAQGKVVEGKTVVGWLEKVWISPGNLLLRAKLDTGAKTCSLTAPNLTEFTKDGQPWVRFDVADKSGKKVTVEQKIQRVARIKRHGSQPQKRVVIRLSICLGNVEKEAEVNLVDRTDFNYPMLLGRNFLQGSFVVDPSGKFTIPSKCQKGVN